MRAAGGLCQAGRPRRVPVVCSSSTSSTSSSTSSSSQQRGPAAGVDRRQAADGGWEHNLTSKRSLHVCTGKVCRKQGSPQLLKFCQDLGVAELTAQESGCLGNCGKGPNMMVMPGELCLRNVGTVADMLEVLKSLSIDIPPVVLQATQLRLAGNALAISGELQAAVDKYNEALALGPDRGRHLLLSNLSAAQLQLGSKQAALEAARAAVACAPRGFHVAHVRLVDALYAAGSYAEAADALRQAVAADASFRQIPEFRVMQQALRQQKQQVL